MVEKRFKKMDTIIDPFPIWDTVEEKGYNCTDTLDLLVDLLNELSGEKEYFERKKEYFLSKWSIVNAKNIQLRQEIDDLKEENEQLRQKIKHCVYVDVDNENGCMNCKYDEGSICSILNCGNHDYLEGVSECGLKYWECKDE